MLANIRGNATIRRVESAIRRRTDAIWEPLRHRFLVVLVVRTVQEMSDDDATHMAAGVAYYALFSLFPLLLGLVALFNLLPASEVRQAQLTDFAAEYLPGSEDLLDRNIEVGGALGVIAIFGLHWSGTAIFGAVTKVVNRAWDVHKDRPIFISKPRHLAMALVVGLISLTSLAAATFVRAAGEFARSDLPAPDFLVELGGQVLLQTGSFALTLIGFLLIYKLMPNTKTYWRYVWPGALVAAVLFEIGKAAFLLYLERFASFQDVYEAVGDVIVLLLWVYVSSLILIVGAELSSEYGRLREGVGRGVLLRRRARPPL
ncbi:MAG: YihY/virulence factor BrkB family protein [Chloroflexi bacterium]|nr:YihY/virulence factor BrkB family protein [Chloroflexota bacterium]